jgi:Fe-S cluster biosynthesis and repair protein YggX
MDKESFNLKEQKTSNNTKDNDDKQEKNEKDEKNENEKKENLISDNIGFDNFFTLSEDNQLNNDNINSDNVNEIENNPQKSNNKKEEIDYKISIDLSDVNKNKIHNYLNDDLIDAIDKSFDDPKDNQCITDYSHNENDTNYSQNNVSNDNDIFSNYTNNFQFYPQNLNSIHNTISFFPKANKKRTNEDNNININNNNNKMVVNGNNVDEKNKGIKTLVDYFGGNNPLDAPIYIPQKFKSLKFNQKPNNIGENIYNRISENNSSNINNSDSDKKEEKCKKPFEIREGDWTCEFCYNLNFAFRTKCNRCGLMKDFLNIKNNLCMNSNDNFNNYNNLMQPNIFMGNCPNQNTYQFINNNNFSSNNLFTPNNSNFP